jgi:hypothetical protein
MPKASVNENDRFIFGKNNVWRAWKLSVMKPISKSQGEKFFSDLNFLSGIFALNTRHHHASC